jgi:thioredoxin 1
MGKLLEITNENFEKEVLTADKLVVVDFWAAWCGPCRMVGPVLEELSQEMSEKVKIVKVNVDENPELADKYQIRSIPTMIFFKNGKEAERSIGAAQKSVIAAKIEKNI